MAKTEKQSTKIKKQTAPLILLEDAVILPVIPQPIKIEDEEKLNLLIELQREHKNVIFGWNLVEDAKRSRQVSMGQLCKIDKILQMPGSPALIFLIPQESVKIPGPLKENVNLDASYESLEQLKAPKRISKESIFILERIKELFEKLLEFLPPQEKTNAESMVHDFSNDKVSYIYAMAQMAPLSLEERYGFYFCHNFKDLMGACLYDFDQAYQRMNIQMSINERTHNELSQQQKETFLRVHLKHIKEELGEFDDSESDITSLLARADKLKWTEEDRRHFDKEIAKLRRLNINNPEYSVQYSYLDTLLSLPWNNYSHKDISLEEVEEILDRDHFGLEKVKERIIEQMAVLKLRNDLKAPIICLFGPPGTGKTSIGRSVADALGREYVRISLGGVHDEAEVRGHRRTYIGAMPGRFMQAFTKIKTGNPLFLLDEIDKLGKDFKGDPSSALLEALDPEQNNTFHDNFIDHPYDLSKALFIATANDISTIPAPLRDRMEIIELSGYIPEEKREIARRHLIEKSLNETGFDKQEISFSSETIDLIIRYYTHEAGVRQLSKKLNKVLRKIARLKASGKVYPTIVTTELAERYLGKHEVNPDDGEDPEFPGVAIGLAWTAAGGDILFIESSLAPGKGEKLTLTGNLGDVMKESAMIALQYLKANASSLGIDPEKFSKYDVHIHVPEGAVPKDGPSAGITIASSIASAFLGKKLREKTAMTGEITLRGKVLPVGGIKEKIIAARQAGINRIILSEENRKDIEEIDPRYIKGLNFKYVKTFRDVLAQAL